MVSPTRVLLVRHGQSTWNAEGRWQGQADPPLSTLGRAQAAAALSTIGAVDAVVASDLVRAIETAKILADGLGVGPVLVDADLRERHAGDWTGLTRAEIDAGWPGYLAGEDRPHGWEPSELVAARARAALARLARELAGGVVVAVTHGGVIRSLEAVLGEEEHIHANLCGRSIDLVGEAIVFGERLVLIDHAAVAAGVIE